MIGDIHGQLEIFKELVKFYDSEHHQLVLLGDLSDRGNHTKECLLLGKKLVEEADAVYIRGNHEDLLLQFLLNPEERFPNYVRNGGKETIESLLHPGAVAEYSPTEISMMIRSRYSELLNFIEKLPLYYEWQDYILVHAGVDLTKKDWHDTEPREFNWIREPFHIGKNNTGKTIVFGHTITPLLHGDMTTTDIWLSDHKIGIDGGGIFGGSVHGVIFNQQGIVQDIEIQNITGPWQPEF